MRASLRAANSARVHRNLSNRNHERIKGTSTNLQQIKTHPRHHHAEMPVDRWFWGFRADSSRSFDHLLRVQLACEPPMSADPAFAALRARLDRRHREATAAAFARGTRRWFEPGSTRWTPSWAAAFRAARSGRSRARRAPGAARWRRVSSRWRRGAGWERSWGWISSRPRSPRRAGGWSGYSSCRVDEPTGARARGRHRGALGRVHGGRDPTLPGGRGTGSAMWTRLASLTHRANALLVALGDAASTELRYFASVRLERRSSACAGTARRAISASWPVTTCARWCANTNAPPRWATRWCAAIRSKTVRAGRRARAYPGRRGPTVAMGLG